MLWLWKDREQELLVAKTKKDAVPKQVQTLIKTLDPAVRDAVIHKYMRYMDQVFLSKAMLYRKSMMINGYPSNEQYTIYKTCCGASIATKMRYLKKIFSQINEGNHQSLTANYVKIAQENYIEDVPPLLDPDLCKDLTNFDQVIDAHRVWCTKMWLPNLDKDVLTNNYKVDGTTYWNLPKEENDLNALYRRLGLYTPQVMEFVPSPALLRKMIIRATQIDPVMIDLVLNPRDLHLFDARHTPQLEEIRRKCPNYPANPKALRMEHVGFKYPDFQKDGNKCFAELGLSPTGKQLFLKRKEDKNTQ